MAHLFCLDLILQVITRDGSSTTASRSAALERLDCFCPRAGLEYHNCRNYDYGRNDDQKVSGLSPYIRIGLLNEAECARTALSKHSERQCRKFLEELFWRVYWKGYLENHRAIWNQYRRDLNLVLRDDSLARGIATAESGRTGIDCFDSWVKELVETGYLHNHARMWFASIWIFTLKLPWQAGAHFFLSHLLDGDVATNTLSWRWVAGLHTKGKTYLARRSNIAKYTGNRFAPAQLASTAVALTEDPIQTLSPRIQAAPIEIVRPSKYGFIFTDDDASIPDFGENRPQTALALFPENRYANAGVSQRVVDFRRSSMDDTVGRLENLGISTVLVCQNHANAIVDWISDHQLETIVCPQPYIGDWNDEWAEIEASIASSGSKLRLFRRWWEADLFPHAQKGFFPFKKRLPAIWERIQSPLAAGLSY